MKIIIITSLFFALSCKTFVLPNDCNHKDLKIYKFKEWTDDLKNATSNSLSYVSIDSMDLNSFFIKHNITFISKGKGVFINKNDTSTLCNIYNLSIDCQNIKLYSYLSDTSIMESSNDKVMIIEYEDKQVFFFYISTIIQSRNGYLYDYRYHFKYTKHKK